MNRIKLTGLWKNTDKNGAVYLAGSLSPGVRLLIFTNGFKKGERDPDLIAYLAASEQQAKAPEKVAAPAETPVRPDEDIPF